jgi:hypothetical protein
MILLEGNWQVQKGVAPKREGAFALAGRAIGQ